jgi:hypothetical protein
MRNSHEPFDWAAANKAAAEPKRVYLGRRRGMTLTQVRRLIDSMQTDLDDPFIDLKTRERIRDRIMALDGSCKPSRRPRKQPGD